MTQDEANYLKEVFEDLLDYEADEIFEPVDPLTYRNPEGDSCLHLAAQRGDLKAIDILIRAGIDINSRGDMGATPLHAACLSGNADVVKLLIRSGANKNARDEFDRLPALENISD
jgi:ankyrin repeat protein